MENEFDYYLIQRDGKSMSPLLMEDDEMNSDGIAFLRRLQRVEDGTTIHLEFNPPSPPKPDMTDYLWLSGGGAVFSKLIFDTFKDIDIKDFQLVPAIIRDPKGNKYSDYWIAGVYGEYAFLDEDETEFYGKTSDGCWNGIEKMVINKEVMAEVLLKDRLIYQSKEDPAYNFYHKSLVDAIMSVNPTGIKFVRVEDWEG